MSVLLICDVPGCPQTTPAVIKQNKPAAPDGWWMQIASGNRIVVACCDNHLTLAAKQAA
jgi:hypothetical protein